jgi:hypothetical protein
MGSLPLITALGLALLQAAPAPSQPSLTEKRQVLQAVVAITTLPPGELMKTPPTTPIEHDSEVAKTEMVTVVVTIQGCQSSPTGGCQATADVVATRPDGSVHSEMKNIPLANGRGIATLVLKASDVTGIYKVEATVRDPIARRVAKTERLFGVK